jgi:hypothetical protein
MFRGNRKVFFHGLPEFLQIAKVELPLWVCAKPFVELVVHFPTLAVFRTAFRTEGLFLRVMAVTANRDGRH